MIAVSKLLSEIIVNFLSNNFIYFAQYCITGVLLLNMSYFYLLSAYYSHFTELIVISKFHVESWHQYFLITRQKPSAEIFVLVVIRFLWYLCKAGITQAQISFNIMSLDKFPCTVDGKDVISHKKHTPITIEDS